MMLRARSSLDVLCLFCALVLGTATRANSQTASSPDTKLALKAALVLTPDMCASKVKSRTGQSFEVGQAACRELEPTLKRAFSSLTIVTAVSSAGDAQVILVPRFVAIDRTGGTTGFSTVKTVLILEWTAKDNAGKTVWLETVQGNATGHLGNMGRVKRNRERDVANAMKDAAEQSASKMSSSPELRKLARVNSSGL
jgi:hypothetical protein